MIESDLEAAAKTQIAAALPDAPADVSGAWDVAAVGMVKGLERPGNGLHLSVVVAPRSYETFTTPVANFETAVVLKADAAQDPTGERFHAACAALVDVLQAWQRSIAAVAAAFTVDGFTPKGLRMAGGEVRRDDENAAWMIGVSFTLRGVIADPETTPTTPTTTTT